ncbi:oxygenase MpaB family protein [Nocardioides sp.]|uniref:oxygenase MpaB family protein n=1 Tax=Nocardioides sp. TaxID=35761 RepID=UPI00356AF0CA
MGVLTSGPARRRGLRFPGRFDNLREIRTLDPERDTDRILWLTSRHEFPWDYTQGTSIAFLRDYGVPSIAALLHATGEFEKHGVKRYDDTLLIAEEATLDGLDSPRGHAAVRRLNRIHAHHDIPADEFRYVLATTIVGPVRWIEQYGWRPLDPVELAAIATHTTRFGRLMGLTDLPTTYQGYLELLISYERSHFRFEPANRLVTESTLRAARAAAPRALRPFVRRITISLMDRPLLDALGLEPSPRWLVRSLHLGLRARAHLLRFAPPRRTPYRHRPSTYPQGYSLGDLGPASMLDELNARPA